MPSTESSSESHFAQTPLQFSKYPKNPNIEARAIFWSQILALLTYSQFETATFLYPINVKYWKRRLDTFVPIPSAVFKIYQTSQFRGLSHILEPNSGSLHVFGVWNYDFLYPIYAKYWKQQWVTFCTNSPAVFKISQTSQYRGLSHILEPISGSGLAIGMFGIFWKLQGFWDKYDQTPLSVLVICWV